MNGWDGRKELVNTPGRYIAWRWTVPVQALSPRFASIVRIYIAQKGEADQFRLIRSQDRISITGAMHEVKTSNINVDMQKGIGAQAHSVQHKA
jgi:hypothetical protein